MPAYRARDLFLLPSVLSAARVPLGVAFPFVVGSSPAALGVLGAAAATDVLDGWTARKLHQDTPTGAIVDGIADKAFAASVLATLVGAGLLSPVAAMLLATREIVELPLALHVAFRKNARDADVTHASNKLGKIATTFEFLAVVAVVAHARAANVLVAATAISGAIAAASYWMRALRAERDSLVAA